MVTLQQRYEAAMVLSGTGDALGYKDGDWEFCRSGQVIYQELLSMGDLQAIDVACPKWIVSDDTVMLLATGEALSELGNDPDQEKLYSRLAHHYKECMNDMDERAPGGMCLESTSKLRPSEKGGHIIPFSSSAGGCGAAMRAMCIGLRYPRPADLKDLVAVSVESGRMTHNHPTGYLGSLASALFTALAIQGRPLREWGRCLLDTLPVALAYVEESGQDVEENRNAWPYFTKAWTDYLKLRNILDGKSDPVFPEPFGFEERDKFYTSISYSGWGGSSGHDAPMIAYDALLGADWSWEELCKRAMFHGGDSDSTGIIAACCYGATKCFEGVPLNNYQHVEYRDRLVKLGRRMFELAYPGESANLQPVSFPDPAVEGCHKDTSGPAGEKCQDANMTINDNNGMTKSSAETAVEEGQSKNVGIESFNSGVGHCDEDSVKNV